MTPLQIGLYLLTALSGAAVVLTREPRRQAIMMGLNGLVLALLFMTLQAPDVAYSELAVNMVALPFLFLVTLAAARINQRRRQAEDK
jgi:energy-converting hydrogenase B subunit D